MMKRGFAVLLAIGAATVAGRMGLGDENERVSRLLLPPPRPAVRDVHARCPAAKKDCAICHENAAESKWASDRLVPPMDTCAECHEAARDATPLSEVQKACKSCHGTISRDNMPVRADYPRPNIRFSHKAHSKGASCASCHPGAAAGRHVGSTLDVVGMRRCLACHQKTACRSCHIVDKDGKMATNFQGEKLFPPLWLKGSSHGPEWAGTHASAAGADSSFCASCHRESYCQSCHTGKRRPRDIHPGDWLTSHGVSTRLDNPRCQGCHRSQTFCITCHRRSGVAEDSPPKARPARGVGQYHDGMETTKLMRKARSNITSCVSCHNESYCVSCHARINPHPPGFERKCKGLAARNRNACARCHTNDPARFCR